ncbi:MAG: DnaA/Hda family protein, partial [Pseudomonadota bacterium]
MKTRDMDARIWADAAVIVKAEIGEAAWKRWIAPLVFAGLAPDGALFRAPSDFIADWVSRHYLDVLKSALNECKADCDRVEVRHEGATSLLSEAEISRAGTGDGVLRSAPLDRRFTFDRFVVGKPNELAHAAARRVAEGADVAFNPVFLHGGVGLGKTHLMHAINWRMNELYPGRKVLYLSAEQFMYRFVQAIRHRS